MPANFRKANSANDGAEWWIADSVAILPLTHNPAIKAGDLAMIKPTDPVVGNRYDIYIYKINPNRWEKLLDGDGNGGGGSADGDEKVKVSANDTTASYLLSKIIAGANVTITENNDGGNETITITAVGPDGGENNTASNVGSGQGFFYAKNGADLQFKSLNPSTGINLIDDGDSIIIESTVQSGEVNTAENRGGGVPVTMDKEGSVLPFKSIVAGTNITLDDSNSEQITINAAGGSGEVNTATNVGGGEGLFITKVDEDFKFKTLIAGANVTLTPDAGTIQISAVGPDGGENNTASSAGEGLSLVLPKNGSDLPFKGLIGGQNINLIENEFDIEINSTGEANTTESRGNGAAITMDKEGSVLPFKSIIAGTNVTIDQSNPEQIMISAVGPDGGENNTSSNTGIGEGTLALPKVGSDLPFKTIKAGAGVTIENNENEVVINAAAGVLRVEEICGKIYIIATIGGIDHAVEITELTVPEIPVAILEHFSMLLATPITAASLLQSIPAGALSYSLSADGGTTWTTPNASPTLAAITLTQADYSQGNASIQVGVTNACGSHGVVVPVVAKRPTPIALNGLSVNLQPSGEITMFAADFDAGSFDTHNPVGGVQLYISKDNIVFTETLTFDCNEVGNQTVYLRAVNDCGASDYAETFVMIQDNMGVC